MRSAIVTGFVISLAVHAGLLVLWLNGNFTSTDTIKSEKAVPVTLAMFEAMPILVVEEPPPPQPQVVEKPKPKPVQKPKPVKKPKPKPKLKKKPRPEPKPMPKPLIQPVQDAVPEEIQESVVASVPSANLPRVNTQVAIADRSAQAADPALLNSIKAQYKAQLKMLIESNKRYPRRAIRMGREGEVLVSFLVLADGTIKQLDIKNGSGSSVLDKAAMDAVQSVSGLLPIPEAIKRRSWQFTVPITYKLM
ncbi:MAG TPA: energy transducer TonB [Chromatiales bacterium]|nr:energy transducer TonB [Thiotrichales bacterium]HIP67786.1 energy transducer TonB [Chromatiales bacterium]